MYLKVDTTAYINLATDDMLYLSNSEEPLNALLQRFRDFFSFKVKRGANIQFLNFRIIQSNYGISIDQSKHITKGILYLLKGLGWS